MKPLPRIYTLFPYTTLFRSVLSTRDGPHPRGLAELRLEVADEVGEVGLPAVDRRDPVDAPGLAGAGRKQVPDLDRDRKSTRLNSSHSQISYAVFCLKKKTIM